MARASHRTRSRSASALSPPQSPTQVAHARCSNCSRLLPVAEMAEHKRFFCSLKTTVCGFCGFRCSGEAALLSHSRKCKARRASGVSLKELATTNRSRSAPLVVQPADLFALLLDSGDNLLLRCSGSSLGPSCGGDVSPYPSGSQASVGPFPSPTLSPPPPLFSMQQPQCSTNRQGARDKLWDDDCLHDARNVLCECCGHTSSSEQEGKRHALVCGAVPVRCPLHCGLTLPRGQVPAHIRESALAHRPLCLPNEHDYGGDDPRMVAAVLMELLLTYRQPSPPPALADPLTPSPDSNGAGEAQATLTSRRTTSPATLPPPTQLFNRHPGSMDSASPARNVQQQHPPFRGPALSISSPSSSLPLDDAW